MRIPLNKGWRFALGEPEGFREVSLPHDWLIDDPQRWYQSGVGWYSRELETPYLAEGRRVFLRFDGVYMNSTLFVNGQKAGEWKYGFTAFEHDITPFLHADSSNVILMKVDARFPSSRWYTGAGIYRDVCLLVRNACHFVSDGIHVTTSLSDGEWRYTASAEVESGGLKYEVRHQLLHEGKLEAWSPEHPRLYTLRSTLVSGGLVMDTVDTRFGCRQLGFDPDKGFSINGTHMKLNGACLHQEFSITGAATCKEQIARQFKALRRMGVNAVRTAHNPPSKAFMELADETGMLVLSEFSDVWQLQKTDHDYAHTFDAWHERDVASWVRRDRNSPSIIMWSLGNEIPDTHADPEQGGEVLRRLQDLVCFHDAGGQALPTLGSNYMAWENTQKAVGSLKAIGYNYSEYLYNDHHGQHPDWVIYGSETCSTVQSRGVYHFPLSQPLLSDDDLQTSSLGNSTTSWGARSVEDCIKDDRDCPFSMGHFIWTGQDYLGEPTPYHTKNSYFGMLDTAGFEKDAYHLFRAAWTREPMLHLFPYWDFSPGQEIDVRVCSNQPKVALFLNDKPLGIREMKGEFTQNWRLPYEAGVLRAEAYDKEGKLAASCREESFGEAVSLELNKEREGGLCYVSISALDKQGRAVRNANREVRVDVKGGTLLGLDNGDAGDYTPYRKNTRRLFSGRLLALIKPHEGEELAVSAAFESRYIPVRKIELHREGYKVRAVLLPEGAMPQDLHWRLTNAAGIDINSADYLVSDDGMSITLKPRFDGDVYIRCGVSNGKPHLDLYSAISLHISGFGQALANPYEEVAAGLYTYSNVQLTNGNERGVATLRGRESWVCFDRLDFGSVGADSFSLWLFPLSSEPFDIQIYNGRPDEGGSLLTSLRYDLGMEWNVYKELRGRLQHPLTGVQSLCFVFPIKTHFRGFRFQMDRRGFEPVNASDCQELYGDSHFKDGPWVRNIGNNTSLLYNGFDFSGKTARHLALRYRSAQDTNMAQVQLISPQGQSRTLLTLPANDGLRERVFPLEQAVTGNVNLRLVFLPGSKLDLASLRFLETLEGIE